VPTPLVVAAALVSAEGLALVVLGVAELTALTGPRLAMGVTTSLFFWLYGGMLLLCARALSRLRSWARAPVVLTQLVQLPVAWSFRGGTTTLVTVALMACALVVLVAIFLPASVRALDDEQAA
jgi:hypothetical protein